MRRIERIVDRKTEEVIVGMASVSVEKWAEEVVRQSLKGDTKWGRSIRELVERRAQEILDELMRKDEKARKRKPRPRKASPRARGRRSR